MGALFPCLPDDIGRECLVRVKLNFHHKLRLVCKSWNAELISPWFYQERKRSKISEQRICLIENICRFDGRVSVYDPTEKTCKSLPPIPSTFESGNLVIDHCSFVKQKLVLIIGVYTNGTLTRKRNCLWLYDFSCSKWREGAEMHECLLSFIGAADENEGLIYVAGFYRSYDRICTAKVYNVQEDKWELLPELNISVDCHSRAAFAHGKFYVITLPPSAHLYSYNRSIHIFDSYNRSWKTIENRFHQSLWEFMENRLHDSLWFVSAFGCLYGFSKRGLIVYDCSRDELKIVGPLPTENWPLFAIWATPVGDKIFVETWDLIQGRVLYMLLLPSETGEAFKWICMESPYGSQRCNNYGAATTLHL